MGIQWESWQIGEATIDLAQVYNQLEKIMKIYNKIGTNLES